MKTYKCKITREKQIPLCSDVWNGAQKDKISFYPWKSEERPYSPEVFFKMLHNREGIFVCFDVYEENIRATYTTHNDPVCRDSCVEFFFSPDNDDKRYLSFEVNPLGTMLIGLSTGGHDLQYLNDDRTQFAIKAKLDDTHWMVSYYIPYRFIEKYFSKIDTVISGNFMKCADLSSTPHHGSWNLIETEIPMFHVPQFFGKIELED